MPEKKRTFEGDVNSVGRLRVSPRSDARVEAGLRISPEKAGAIAEMQARGFSRETILRLIDWIKKV